MELNKVYNCNPLLRIIILTLSNSNNSYGHFSDLSFESQTVTISCQITTSPGVISAECTFPNETMATGFQMIAQLNNSSEVHKLYINQSMDLQTPVTVILNISGLYQVTILAILNNSGIVTNAEYIAQNLVEIENIVTISTHVTTSSVSTFTLKDSNSTTSILGLTHVQFN